MTTPIYKFLRRHDSSAPTVGKLYSGWYELGEFIKTCNSSYVDHAVEKHAERWAYGHSAISAAAYVVDPEFHAHEQEANEEVMEGFMDATEKVGILLEVRRRMVAEGSKYNEWQKRKKMIVMDPSEQDTYTFYPDYPTVKDAAVAGFCAQVTQQLGMYKTKKGIFAREWVMNAAESMPAHAWWDQNGSSVPELQAVARLVLAQPGSASICERINSEFAFVKDRRRNRLQHRRANMLVALFHNLRLMFRMKKLAYEEPAVAWTDVEKPDSGIQKYGVSHYSSPTVTVIAKPTRPPLPASDEQSDEGEL
ncbi:hypothetical protein AB1Y20_021818 [Prymnesium parvum]|uniref:HAT C-terminal dimerisation domain-containing protein n=1 Tax=Prymnesium parvum TaxID=97485 RepID=A0AB34JJU0_PRYPA|mmetsp:Transcript_17684/g.26626  ORF Transcript_17684/g.26626 Transcript_17684/m.26626 type:complete len:307 (+) Transcript_17684:1473-2393(+)